ncbi:MAG TPA: competence/damage-inducible protein A [Gemmatimonadota bacterium]|nr:competence/damage-inducible protein A [Gemmatimonadota bacterium]
MSELGPRSAAVVIVGDEILSGEVLDQNAPFLTRRLWELGIKVERIEVVADRRDELAGEIRALADRNDFVLVTGGLGPTHDDVTRQAVADALDLPLEVHAGAVELLADDFGDRLTPAEEAMARLPRGSRILRGRQRLAYGFRVAGVFVFPGVPVLLQDIFEVAAEDLLSAPFFKETLWVCGKEGDFSETLAGIQSRHPAVGIGSYPVFMDGRYRCKVVLRARDRQALAGAVGAIEAELEMDAPP